MSEVSIPLSALNDSDPFEQIRKFGDQVLQEPRRLLQILLRTFEQQDFGPARNKTIVDEINETLDDLRILLACPGESRKMRLHQDCGLPTRLRFKQQGKSIHYEHYVPDASRKYGVRQVHHWGGSSFGPLTIIRLDGSPLFEEENAQQIIPSE